jgi:hypothetical protein
VTGKRVKTLSAAAGVALCLAVLMIGLAAASPPRTPSFMLPAQVVDSGGLRGASASFQLLGKSRERGVAVIATPSLIIGEGFLRSVYFSRPILGPIVTAIDPSSSQNNKTVSVVVTGGNFAVGARLQLSLSGQNNIPAVNVVVVSSGKLTGDFDLTGAQPGLWTVTVINPNGASGSLPAAFKILGLAPTLLSITPDNGTNNQSVSVVIAGQNFAAGAQAKLSLIGQNDIPGTDLGISAGKIVCRFDLNGRAVGRWDVVVTNNDGQSAALPAGFKVEAPEIECTQPVDSEKNPYDPATGITHFRYSLSRDADIAIYIFNIRGERVWSYQAPAGSQGGQVGANSVAWNGLTAYQTYASGGAYLVYVTTTVNGGPRNLSMTKLLVIK